MSSEYAILWMFAWLFLVSWLVGCALSWALTYLPLARPLGLQRCQILWTSALPLVLPIVMSAAMIIPAMAKSMGWIKDHCLVHFQHHPHFCFEHLPEFLISISQSTFTYTGLSLVSFLFLSRMLHLLWDQRVQTIQRIRKSHSRLLKVDSTHVFAFTAGIKQPFIVLSNSLLSILSKHEQRMIIAHEIAHIRNRDVLKQQLFELLLSFSFNKRYLRQAWTMNTESLADNHVSQHFDALTFASLLLRLKQQDMKHVHGASIAGASFEDRIKRLIEPQTSTSTRKYHGLFLSMIILMIGLLSYHHHAIESALGWWLIIAP